MNERIEKCIQALCDSMVITDRTKMLEARIALRNAIAQGSIAVVNAEREACAKACDDTAKELYEYGVDTRPALTCAETIRSRIDQ